MLAAGLLLALATSPAPAVDLRWDAPAGCPPRAELERQIAALLAGHAPAGPPPRVAFRVERRAAQWHLHGEITGAAGSGQRDLGAATCGELVEAAALITAIAIDPTFVPGESPSVVPPAPQPSEPGEPGEPQPPPNVEPTAPPPIVEPTAPPSIVEPTAPPPIIEPTDPPPDSPPDRATPARPRDRARLLLGLSAGLGLGALPAPAGLLRLVLGLRGRLWSAAVVQDFWLPRDGFIAAAPDYGGRFWLWSAGLRGCGVVPLARRLDLPVCATIAAGVHSGAGKGAVTTSRRQISPWLGAAVGPGLHVRLGPRVRLTLALELLGILARPDFRIAGRGRACCDDRLGGQFTAGVELVLP